MRVTLVETTVRTEGEKGRDHLPNCLRQAMSDNLREDHKNPETPLKNLSNKDNKVNTGNLGTSEEEGCKEVVVKEDTEETITMSTGRT